MDFAVAPRHGHIIVSIWRLLSYGLGLGPAAYTGIRLSPQMQSLPDEKCLLIMTYGQPASVCVPGFCNGQVRSRGQRRCLPGGWSVLLSIGAWVCI